ncbi:unnamed protein product [Cuscuta epithymum]|uniref:Uncharacterized protein n=1 Tax=Cuscuta epithymum TaxID=186058 RepID=A0AAV0EMX2_9ASTE|nr:unnamed protein product [Cuscuta epithymum]
MASSSTNHGLPRIGFPSWIIHPFTTRTTMASSSTNHGLPRIGFPSFGRLAFLGCRLPVAGMLLCGVPVSYMA